MKYNNQTDREDIQKAMDMLFAEFRTSLPKVCDELDLVYNSEYQHLYRNHINHSRVEKIVHHLAPDRFIQRQNNRLVISRKF